MVLLTYEKNELKEGQPGLFRVIRSFRSSPRKNMSYLEIAKRALERIEKEQEAAFPVTVDKWVAMDRASYATDKANQSLSVSSVPVSSVPVSSIAGSPGEKKELDWREIYPELEPQEWKVSTLPSGATYGRRIDDEQPGLGAFLIPPGWRLKPPSPESLKAESNLERVPISPAVGGKWVTVETGLIESVEVDLSDGITAVWAVRTWEDRPGEWQTWFVGRQTQGTGEVIE